MDSHSKTIIPFEVSNRSLCDSMVSIDGNYEVGPLTTITSYEFEFVSRNPREGGLLLQIRGIVKFSITRSVSVS